MANAITVERPVQPAAMGFAVLSADTARNPTTADGRDGDFWLNQNTSLLFRRKSGTWVTLWKLKGTKGSPGNQGSRGLGVLYGTAEPDDDDGVDGQFYLQTAGAGAPLIYGPKVSGAWPVGVSMLGAQPWQTPPVAWVTGTAYVADAPASCVTYDGETFVCAEAHTAGTFATDEAAGKWVKIAAKGADGNGVGNVNPAASSGNAGAEAVFSSDDGKLLRPGLPGGFAFCAAMLF